MAVTLGDLAEHLGAVLQGNPAVVVRRVATLDGAQPGDVTFLFDRRYRKFLKVTGASAVILGGRDAAECPVAALVCDNPYLGYARAAQLLHPQPLPVPGVHPSAWVAEGARVSPTAWIGPQAVVEEGAHIGDAVFIGPGSVVGQDASIGDYTRLVANVTVCHGVTIGRRCVLQPGSVIGADGFGLARDGHRWEKIPQLGAVHIGDDVEIGANTTVDRGALKDTVIEEGVKLDNLIQVGHNTRIGAHTAAAGCVGISGSATIGKRCLLGGGVGVGGHIEIVDDVTVTGMTMVSKSLLEPGTYSSGWPARESVQWRRTVAGVNLSARSRDKKSREPT